MIPHLVSLLLVFKLDDDNFLATSSKTDVIKGAFSLKRGDIKGEQDVPRFADLSSASDTSSLFFVIEHSGTSGEIIEACVMFEVELLTRMMRFGGRDFRGDFLLCWQNFGFKRLEEIPLLSLRSRSNSKRGRQLFSL